MAKLSKKAKIIIGILLTAMVMTVVLFGLGIWFIESIIDSGFSRSKKELPPDIAEPRIVTGGEAFTKSEFYRQKKMGFFSSILKSITFNDEKEKQRFLNNQNSKNILSYSAAGRCGDKVIFAGKFGSQTFDNQGNLVKEISFEPSSAVVKFGNYGSQRVYQVNADKVSILSSDKNGNCGYSAMGAIADATSFDENGNIIWERGKDPLDLSIILKDKKEIREEFKNKIFVSDFTVGDIDNDGNSEFIVLKREDGVYSYDRSSKEIWAYKNNELRGELEILDFDGDGKNELLLVDKDTKIFDSKGKVSKELVLDRYPKSYLFSDGINKKKSIDLLDIDENKLTLSDEMGKVKITANAPLSKVKLKEPVTEHDPIYEGGSYTYDSESVSDPVFIWAQLQKDKKYLAVIAPFKYLSRSNLFIYEPEGKLVYHELLPEDAETIVSMPQSNGVESILVGGKDTIWKFDMK